jgi:hypothetical protein
LRREVGRQVRIARTGRTDGEWKFRRPWAGLGRKLGRNLGWNRGIRWRVGGPGIVRTGICGDFETACGRRYGGNWYGGIRYRGNRGGRRLILAGLRVRRAGLHDRRRNRKRVRHRKRQRCCHAGEVRPVWREWLLIQWLRMRGKIGKVGRGSREPPLLEYCGKWGVRSTTRSERNGGNHGGSYGRPRLSLRGWSGWRAEGRKRKRRAGLSSLGRKSDWLLHRKRRRCGHNGEVCIQWLLQLLQMRGRIGKGRCGSGNPPLLENRQK